MNVTIVGAGIAGLAAAIGLARSGHQVTVIERSPEPCAPSDFGIQITANGMRVLAALGACREAAREGVQASQASILDSRTGRTLLKVALTQGNSTEGQYLLCRRNALVRNLENAALAERVSVVRGADVLDLEETGDGVRCVLQDGSILDSSLLVGADGLHSRCRRHLNPGDPDLASTHFAWRACYPDLAAGIELGKILVFVGPGRHMVVYSPDQDRSINLVAVRRLKSPVPWQPPSIGDPDELRQQFGRFGGDVRTLLQGIGTVGRWSLCDAKTPDRWFSDRTVLIGDALHPVLPFLAQGGSLALEDAWVLVRLLAKHSEPAGAFRDFRRVRETRVARVSRASRLQGWLYHLQLRALSRSLFGMMALGDTVLPGLAKMPIEWIHKMDVVSGWPEDTCAQASSSTQMGT